MNPSQATAVTTKVVIHKPTEPTCFHTPPKPTCNECDKLVAEIVSKQLAADKALEGLSYPFDRPGQSLEEMSIMWRKREESRDEACVKQAKALLYTGDGQLRPFLVHAFGGKGRSDAYKAEKAEKKAEN